MVSSEKRLEEIRTDVVVVGAGAISRRATLPVLKSLPSLNVVGIVDLDEGKAKAVAREFNVPNFGTNYGNFLKDETTEMFFVCTSPQSHAKIVLDCVGAGKHVLVEKPMVLRLQDAIKIERSIENRPDAKVSVVHNYRYFKAVNQSLARLRQGYLGRLVSVQGIAHTQFPVGWTRSMWLYEHGVMYDFVPHLADLVLLFCNSRPKTVFAVGGDLTGNMGFPNNCQIMVDFEDGVVASMDTSWLTGSFLFQIFLHGTGGHILLDPRQNHFKETHGMPTPFDDAGDFVRKMTTVMTGVMGGDMLKGALLTYRLAILDFLDSIENRRDTAPDLRRDVLSIAILNAADESMEKHQPVVIDELLKRPSQKT